MCRVHMTARRASRLNSLVWAAARVDHKIQSSGCDRSRRRWIASCKRCRACKVVAEMARVQAALIKTSQGSPHSAGRSLDGGLPVDPHAETDARADPDSESWGLMDAVA